MWSPQSLVCKESFDADSIVFLMWMFVILGSGEYTGGFVPLLNLGRPWSGRSSRHDCEYFRATHVNCGGRVTTRSGAYVYWGFQRSTVRMCASKLAIVLRRHDVVATAPGWKHLLHESGLCFVCVWTFVLVST